VRHDVEEETVRLTGVEERQDVRVLEARRRPDLGQKRGGAHDRGELGLQDLQRDLSPVPDVVGQIDRGHTALTELALDAVAAA